MSGDEEEKKLDNISSSKKGIMNEFYPHNDHDTVSGKNKEFN